jgi:hypothetical protein
LHRVATVAFEPDERVASLSRIAGGPAESPAGRRPVIATVDWRLGRDTHDVKDADQADYG